MNRIALTLASLAFLASPLLAAPDDDRVAARSSALDVAGAWSNDGFKLRDGYWGGTIKPGAAKVIQVNLYAGNQYWFTLAGSGKAKKMAVTIFDETGKAVTAENFEDGARAAAGFCPAASGPYLIKIEEVEGEPASFALVYSFK